VTLGESLTKHHSLTHSLICLFSSFISSSTVIICFILTFEQKKGAIDYYESGSRLRKLKKEKRKKKVCHREVEVGQRPIMHEDEGGAINVLKSS
jgi:hypothetical protein